MPRRIRNQLQPLTSLTQFCRIKTGPLLESE
jgi:hypothetical protein